MKKHFLSILLLSLLIQVGLFTLPAHAQDAEIIDEVIGVEESDSATDEDNIKEEEIIESTPLVAKAGKDKTVAVERNVVFDASGSTGPIDQELSYAWDFGDGQTFNALEASHIYDEPGIYKATLTVSDDSETSKDSILVSVAKDVVVLLTDDTVARETTRHYKEYAARYGTLVIVMRPKDPDQPTYTVARNLAERLITSEEDLDQADLVITWTEKNIGLDALSEVGRIFDSGNDDVTTSSNSFGQKAIVRVDEKQAGPALSRLAQNTFNVLEPKYVLLTTTESLEELLRDPNPENIINNLKAQGFEYEIIGSHSQRVLGTINPINFISYGVNYLINEGVSPDSIFLLLILPVVATIIAFGRQVVGVRAFGIYVPTLITLIFVITRLQYGLLIFAVLLLTATAARLAARRLRLLYMPRMAIVLTVVAFAIFALFIVGSYFHATGLLSISIFPILVMIILTEKFVEAQIEQGQNTAIILTIETLVLAIVSYSIVTWDTFETFIMAYPELVLITIVLNIILGRFTGLRLSEYLRFKTLFSKKT